MEKRVLIVDDEIDIVSILKSQLEREGYKVVDFHNGTDALEYIQNHSVELVISDIRMPGISGTELFFKIRKIDPFLQIIIISAYPDLETITRMLEAGATDYIVKPFKIEYIKGIVAETFSKIERWRSLRKEILSRRAEKNIG